MFKPKNEGVIMNISTFFKLLVFVLCASQSVGYAVDRDANLNLPVYIFPGNELNRVRIRFSPNILPQVAEHFTTQLTTLVSNHPAMIGAGIGSMQHSFAVSETANGTIIIKAEIYASALSRNQIRTLIMPELAVFNNQHA